MVCQRALSSFFLFCCLTCAPVCLISRNDSQQTLRQRQNDKKSRMYMTYRLNGQFPASFSQFSQGFCGFLTCNRWGLKGHPQYFVPRQVRCPWKPPSDCPEAENPYHCQKIWVLPKIGVPQNGWFILENPLKIDDLGVPSFLETSIYKL